MQTGGGGRQRPGAQASSVSRLVQKLPAAPSILRGYGIDTSGGLSLRAATMATSAEPGEVLAQIEARVRRLAARPAEEPREKYADQGARTPVSR